MQCSGEVPADNQGTVVRADLWPFLPLNEWLDPPQRKREHVRVRRSGITPRSLVARYSTFMKSRRTISVGTERLRIIPRGYDSVSVA